MKIIKLEYLIRFLVLFIKLIKFIVYNNIKSLLILFATIIKYNPMILSHVNY